MSPADIIESNPTVWDQFTMKRDSDSPVQGRLPYTPDEWAALTTEQRDANRQTWFNEWQTNMDALLAAAVAAEEAAALLPPPVPSQVTSVQARKAVLAAGLKTAVEAAVSDSDQATQDLWYTAEYIERADPILNALAERIWGYTSDEMLDQLFIAAQGM